MINPSSIFNHYYPKNSKEISMNDLEKGYQIRMNLEIEILPDINPD
jgi:hypothetical protein